MPLELHLVLERRERRHVGQPEPGQPALLVHLDVEVVGHPHHLDRRAGGRSAGGRRSRRRWSATESVVSTSTEATPGRDGRDGSTTRPSVSWAGTCRSALVVTSGHTTTSRPQITPLFTSSTATEPSASVSSTVPVSPPLFRLPLNAPERMSVSGSQRQPIDGRRSGQRLDPRFDVHRRRPQAARADASRWISPKIRSKALSSSASETA